VGQDTLTHWETRLSKAHTSCSPLMWLWARLKKCTPNIRTSLNWSGWQCLS